MEYKSIVYHHLLAHHHGLLVYIAEDALIVEVVGNRSEGTPHHSAAVLGRRLAVLELVLDGLYDLVLQGSFVVLVRALERLVG